MANSDLFADFVIDNTPVQNQQQVKGTTTTDLFEDFDTGEQPVKQEVAAPETPQQSRFTQAQQEEQQRLLEQQARETGPVESFLVGAGRGLTSLLRGVGLAEPEEPVVTRGFEALEEERPISTTAGEITGQAAPFLAPGVGIGAIPSAAGRIAAGAALGGTEGTIVARGEGRDLGEQIISGGAGAAIGGTAEALFPVVGRAANSLFRKVTGRAPEGQLLTPQGRPTPELEEALQQAGTTFDDLTVEAQRAIGQQRPGSNPQQVARAAVLESVGAPATRGDVTGEFAQQATEARLLESAANPAADPLRSLRLKQSRAFESELDKIIQETGVPTDIGTTLKEALSGRKKLLQSEKNDLYKQFAESSKDIGTTPIVTDTIIAALPDPKTIRRLSRTAGTQLQAVDDLLVEFGIDRTASKVDDFVKKGGEVEPLNIQNFDEFRQELGRLGRSDQTGTTSLVTGPLIKAVDEEAGLVEDAIRAAGVTDEAVLAPLKEARKTVRQIKTEFSPQAVSGRLIDVKRDGVTPLVESSAVFKELLGPNKAPELLTRTMESLRKGGDKGKKAIKDLQARATLELLDAAMGTSRRIDGEAVFSSAAFDKKLKQLGEDRLKELFKGNQATLSRIKKVGKAAKITTPPPGAVPKGSASVLLDVVQSGLSGPLAAIPGFKATMGTVSKVIKEGGDAAEVSRALRARPEFERIRSVLEREAPNVARALAVSAQTKELDED